MSVVTEHILSSRKNLDRLLSSSVDITGFDKSENTLFEIYSFTSERGFIFVNFDASAVVPPPDTSILDAFAYKNGIQVQTSWVAGQAIEGAFNWKMCHTNNL
ncbi:hypothetical protein EYZ11_000919 [Aspergillus tanneri]|uniref:Uncharacterized protein n=1 Tax=Aspergillus tanneri TaxID=1220188 RepID=A0A4S3JW16_9EURO|nr:hypothetical protein EYZ11_000919 [Aspergillus tanneri]